MSTQDTSHDQNPPFFHHIKMLLACLGTAVALAGGIAMAAYAAYQAAIWIGSH
ncbi:MAG: hypothetical protein ACK5QT_01525 [Oligoflexia bacterium]|jgi:hypothetical protein